LYKALDGGWELFQDIPPIAQPEPALGASSPAVNADECADPPMASRAEPTSKLAPAPSRGNIRLSPSRAGAHIPAPQKFQLPLQRVDPMIEIIDAGGVECGFKSGRRHQDGIGGNGVAWRAESSVGRFHPGCSQRWRQQTRINELASPSNTSGA
jgi:hypothetical protein